MKALKEAIEVVERGCIHRGGQVGLGTFRSLPYLTT
jgi:hypothetical protein